jgi:hypothetical protein
MTMRSGPTRSTLSQQSDQLTTAEVAELLADLARVVKRMAELLAEDEAS